jgi:hypothetical protein
MSIGEAIFLKADRLGNNSWIEIDSKPLAPKIQNYIFRGFSFVQGR